MIFFFFKIICNKYKNILWKFLRKIKTGGRVILNDKEKKGHFFLENILIFIQYANTIIAISNNNKKKIDFICKKIR